LTGKIIGAAIKVHRKLGPGLLESTYQKCLHHELSIAGMHCECEKELLLTYDGLILDAGYRIDLVVEGKIIVEVKATQKIDPVHEAQLLTYLKLSGITLGLLINFNVPVLREGLKRIVMNFHEPPVL
jgi:GxxExxY protein